MNRIPYSPALPTANYYCTWTSQGNWKIPKGASCTSQDMRDRIDSDFLFGADGILTAHPTGIRRDLLVVLDDGWDVAHGTTHTGSNNSSGNFGSMIFDAGKFPELAALSPRERLIAVSERVRALGYAGLGLWVPSNYFGEDPTADRAAILHDAQVFWTERGKWCADADIRYLKVDWGFHGRDVEYRNLMTEAVKKQSPNTLVEHVIGIFDMPYDPDLTVQNDVPYRDFQALARKTFSVSDVYRTYDVVDTFATATTLMRIAKFFDGALDTKASLAGLINVEDEVLIAAALGMNMGVMRHTNSPYYLETVGALRWQRIAPAFGAVSGQLQCSQELLCDRYFFDTDPEAWPYVGQKNIEQYAPARISRCAPLPEVQSTDSEHKPFVLCSKHPDTGAFSVAALSRTTTGHIKYRAPADVTIFDANIDAPVGIFGSYQTLTIHFDSPIGQRRIYMQNLLNGQELCDEAVEITKQVHIENNALTIDGAFLDAFAADTLENPPVSRDKSENCLVLQLL